MPKAKIDAPTPFVTGGRVLFKRSFQPDAFGNRGAEVELTFAVPEGATGAEDFLNTVGELALAKALDLTYRKAKATPAVKETVAEAPAEKPKAAPVRTKADLEAEQAAALATEKPKVKMPSISTGEERVDPNEWEAPPAEVISDQAMKDGCSRRNQVIKNPQAIKGLIAKFVPFPKGCADIPQDKRADFLAQLAALEK
jgi:hypothetical protein